MVYLFIIAWILSPIVLIPLTIISSKRKSKLESFITELYNSGRISCSEYVDLSVKKEAPVSSLKTASESAPVFSDSHEHSKAPAKPVTAADVHREAPSPDTVITPVKQPAPAEPARPVLADEGTANTLRQPRPAVHNAPEKSSAAPVQPAKPVFRDEETAKAVRQPSPLKAAPAQKRDTNKRAGAMSVLMTIGVIFVILAGLVFSTAVWVNLGKLGRTCAVGIITALFFGISAFAHKKLKLESTAFAFFNLGTFFSAITLLTAGYFGLFGSYLSVTGGGDLILFSLAALIICLLSARGRSIFNKLSAAYISVSGGALSAVLLLIHISDEKGMFALLMALLTLAVNTIVYTLDIRISDKWEKPVKAVSAVLYAVALISGAASMFTNSALAYACAGLYALRSVIAAVMGFKGHRIYKSRFPAAVSLLSGIFFSVALMWQLSDSLQVFALILTISALLFIGGFFTLNVNIPDEWEGSVKFSALLLYATGLISSFTALGRSFGEWNFVCFAVAGLYIVNSFAVGIMAVYGHNVYEKASSAFVSMFTGMAFTVMLVAEISASAAAAALILTVLFLVLVNAVYSVSARLPEGWKGAVDIASSVLGLISSICSIFVLGENFGQWDAACFIIAALYIIQSAAVTIMAYKGHHIYGKTVFGVLSQLTGIAFALITLSELAANELQFALFLTLFAVIYLNLVYTFSLKKPDGWIIPLDLSAAVLFIPSVLYSGCQMINSFGNWSYECYAIAALYIIQSAAVTIMAYNGHHIYGKTVFGVLSQLMGIAFALITLSELSANELQFALFLTVFAVIYLNFVYTFSLKKPDGWIIPLDLSAAVLFIPSVLYSGCQMINSFGNWSYECYACAGIYIAMAMAVTAMAYLGHSEYTKARWAVFAHMTGLIFTVLLLAELAPGEKCLILSLALLAVLFTAAGDVTFLKAPEKWLPAAKVSEILLNIAAAIASAGMLIADNTDWDIYCIVTAAVYILYTAVWGIRFNNSLLKAAECVISSFAMYNAYCLIDDKFTNAPLFILVCILFASALIHHFAKPIRTVFSDIFLPAAVMISSLCQTADEGIFEILGFALLLILLLIKSAEKDNSLAKIFGILLPLPVTGMVFSAASMIGNTLPYCFEYGVNAAVLALIAAALLITKKRSGAVFYSFAITASVMALIGLESSSMGIQLLILAVTVLLTGLFGRSANNLPSLLTMTGSAIALVNIANMAEPMDSSAVHILAAVTFSAACLIASRMFFSKKLLEKEAELFRLDTFCTGMILSIPMLDVLSGNASVFAVLTLLAIFTANLARKEQHDDLNKAFLTAGYGLFTIALINRPFLTVSDPLFSFKITLGLICIFGFVFSKIWKKYPKLSENFSAAVYGISFMCLIIEALSRQNLFNTLIVLGVSLVILLFSFVRKKKRWFAVSSVALTGLTLYIFRDFFRMIDWWVYLLVVGLLLIAVASANEYFIKKGRELKEKAGRFFEDWTW
ncbi:MAG: hypothetical protein ACI4J0_00580 [Huintestinicola sp.]|uniref:hypothetical protein n=1 Tax=Huintestinicola sp. TaxID=2981661 RepID=UPI003F0881FA